MSVSSISTDWLNNFLTQAEAADKAKQRFKMPAEPAANATEAQWRDYHVKMQHIHTGFRQAVQKQIESGSVKGILDIQEEWPEPEVVPDMVDGVETGFLNSRYITLEYLSRAEDLVENHPEVAEQIFKQDDPMHRFILTMVKNQEFDSGMSPYKDEIDQQYAEEGQKLAGSGGGLAGIGSKYQFVFARDVTQMMFGNGFVNTVEKGVQDVASQQENIDQLQQKLNNAQYMASNAMYRQSSNPDMSPQQAQEFASAWQDEEELLRGKVADAKIQMQEALQKLKNLEARGIAGDVTATLFNMLFAAQTGKDVDLEDLYRQYQVASAEPYIDHAANSGFSRRIQEIAQQSADIREKYSI